MGFYVGWKSFDFQVCFFPVHLARSDMRKPEQNYRQKSLLFALEMAPRNFSFDFILL